MLKSLLSKIRVGKAGTASEKTGKKVPTSVSSSTEGVAGYLLYANSLFSKGESDEAVRVLGEALARFPGDVHILERMVQVYTARHDYRQAARFGREMVDRFPDQPQGYLLLARALHLSGQLPAAIEILRVARDKQCSQEVLLLSIRLYLSAKNAVEAGTVLKALDACFPNLKQYPTLKGRVCLLRDDFKQAFMWFKKSMDRFPDFLEPYLLYGRLHASFEVPVVEKDDQSTVLGYMEQCIACFPNMHSAYFIFGKWLYDALGDVQRAKSILLSGMELEHNENIIILLYKIALFEGDRQQWKKYRRTLTQIDPNRDWELVFLPECYAAEAEAALPPYRSLDEVVPRTAPLSPQIVDAESYAFDEEQDSDKPCIALFVYSRPRQNLDIMCHFYSLLKGKGFIPLLFLDRVDIDHFDFSGVSSCCDRFYLASSSFFSSCNFISCIITNDASRLNGASLFPSSKLIFHAPHNVNLLGIYSTRAHYFTYLGHQDPPSIDDLKKSPRHMDKYCAIRNSYSKDELLLDSFCNSEKTIKAISYCPTSAGLVAKLDICKFAENVDTYIDCLIEMIKTVLNSFPDYYFIFRPYLLNYKCSIDWLVAKPIVEAFVGEERFIFDFSKDSKYAILLSDILITDGSGLALTYAELAQRPFITFSPGGLPEVSEKYFSHTVCADTVADVVRTCRQILDTYGDRVQLHPEDYPPETLARFRGASYLVDNMEYILEDKIHPDWKYYDLTY